MRKRIILNDEDKRRMLDRVNYNNHRTPHPIQAGIEDGLTAVYGAFAIARACVIVGALETLRIIE